MRTRLDLLNTLPKGSVGAELGVFMGDFATEIIKRVQPALFYMVDLFEGRVTSGDVNGENLTTVDMGSVLSLLLAKYSSIDVDYTKPCQVVVQCDSVEWLRLMPANCLDWVYIDTDHTYARTCAELREARRVVKPGGIIAGHDFDPQFPGVINAVLDFVRSQTVAPRPRLELFAGDKLASYRLLNLKVANPQITQKTLMGDGKDVSYGSSVENAREVGRCV